MIFNKECNIFYHEKSESTLNILTRNFSVFVVHEFYVNDRFEISLSQILTKQQNKLFGSIDSTKQMKVKFFEIFCRASNFDLFVKDHVKTVSRMSFIKRNRSIFRQSNAFGFYCYHRTKFSIRKAKIEVTSRLEIYSIDNCHWGKGRPSNSFSDNEKQ